MLRCFFCDGLGHSKLSCSLVKRFNDKYEKRARVDVSGFLKVVLVRGIAPVMKDDVNSLTLEGAMKVVRGSVTNRELKQLYMEKWWMIHGMGTLGNFKEGTFRLLLKQRS